MVNGRYKEKELLLGTLLYRISLGTGAVKISIHLEGFRPKIPMNLGWGLASDTTLKLSLEVT